MDKYTIAPPSGSTNNSIGAEDRPWQEGHFGSVKLNGGDLGEYLAESTGYGIVSGCEPSISGLTVTVGAGIVHLADGTRKEISASTVTLDPADSTNPRIDLVYIDSTGTVAKITGTAAASPSAPSVPTGGISVCTVSVAAGATTGTLTDKRFIIKTSTNMQKEISDKPKINIIDYIGHNGDSSGIDVNSSLRGFKWVRCGAYWRNVETQLGVYNWTTTDARQNSANENGQKLLINFGDNNTLYGVEHYDRPIKSGQLAGFKNFVEAYVQRYAGNGNAYAFWNEPATMNIYNYGEDTDSYMAAVAVISNAVRTYDASAKVVIGDSVQYDEWPARGTEAANYGLCFFRDCFAKGLASYIDAFSIHVYGEETNLLNRIHLLRGILADNDVPDMPIWITEFGWSTYGENAGSAAKEELRAKYVVRYILCALSLNIKHVLVYTTRTNRQNPDNPQDWYGYMDSDDNWSMLPMGTAIVNFYNRYKNATFLGRINIDKVDDYLMMLELNGDIHFAYWTTSASHNVKLPNGQTVNFTDSVQFLNTYDNRIYKSYFDKHTSHNTVRTGSTEEFNTETANKKFVQETFGYLLDDESTIHGTSERLIVIDANAPSKTFELHKGVYIITAYSDFYGPKYCAIYLFWVAGSNVTILNKIFDNGDSYPFVISKDSNKITITKNTSAACFVSIGKLPLCNEADIV